MLDVLWNVRSYFFWLLAISLFCFVLERLWPWRKEQKVLRPQFGQDLFFLFFNGHFFGLALAHLTAWVLGWLPEEKVDSVLAGAPWVVQFVVFFVIKDFLEWCVHCCLHRFRFLWNFHKLHHSITELDWIGNFRFHWMEIVVYRSLTYLPLLWLQVPESVLLPIAVVTTLVQDLNHANLDITWGPLRYVLNSPRMHVWHHDVVKHHPHGQNYAIVFSVWDWLFKTVYWPADRKQPERLGFRRMKTFPDNLLRRLIYPFYKGK